MILILFKLKSICLKSEFNSQLCMKLFKILEIPFMEMFKNTKEGKSQIKKLSSTAFVSWIAKCFAECVNKINGYVIYTFTFKRIA